MAEGSGTGNSTESKSDVVAAGYLKQFDNWVLVLLGSGLVASLLYGLSAGTYVSKSGCIILDAQTDAARSAGGTVLCTMVSHLGGGLLAFTFCLAATMIGAALGFLFGLPRTLTGEVPRRPDAAATGTGSASGVVTPNAPGDDDQPSSHQLGAGVNTNLERISNWLTTIIVGVGLTNLQNVPPALESFGARVADYFTFGGQLFGIGGGLFFLIAGFFLAYVGTRVKLSRVFLRSQIDGFLDLSGVSAFAASVQVAVSAPPVTIATQAEAVAATLTDPGLQAADSQLLGKALTELKTNDEIIAWANAKARAGDFAAAITGYRDILKRVPPTEELTLRFASILARSGDTAEAQRVLDGARTTTGISPADQSQARKAVSAISLQSRLRDGLYKPRTELGWQDAILAGEELIKDSEQAKVGINHLWLACAYAQKVRAIGDQLYTPTGADELSTARTRAVEEVEAAVAADPSLRELVARLYDPSRQEGDDDDLQFLNPDPRIDALIAG